MLAVLALLAFIVGFSVHRGTNCSVVAARQLARRRDPTRLTSFVVGACAALAIAMPLVWLHPESFKTAVSFGVTWAALIGGACYGLGALVNGACALGTVVRISEGRLAFLATIPGIGLGAFLAGELGLAGYRGEAGPALMAAPGAVQTAAVLSAAIIAIATLWATLMRIARARYGLSSLLRTSRWRPILAMLITGAAGGLAFVIAEPWAWPSLVRRVSQALSGGAAEFPAPMLVGPVALFAGGFTASFLSGRLRLRWQSARQLLRPLLGGVIMGTSAALVPGGNDVMLLHALPSLAVSGILAYAAMFAVLVPVLATFRRLRTVPEA
jgi:hypothetical protein